jgi:hypothetical protein
MIFSGAEDLGIKAAILVNRDWAHTLRLLRLLHMGSERVLTIQLDNQTQKKGHIYNLFLRFKKGYS